MLILVLDSPAAKLAVKATFTKSVPITADPPNSSSTVKGPATLPVRIRVNSPGGVLASVSVVATEAETLTAAAPTRLKS